MSLEKIAPAKLATKAPAQTLSHESAWLHVTGAARYTDELAMPAGTLSLWPVLADCAHGSLLSLELDEARAMPGVHLVLSAADIPGINNIGPIVPDEVLLPTTQIDYHGQALAWVAAESDVLAEAAAKRVRFQIRPLSPVLDIDAAVSANSFHLAPKQLNRGTAETALQQAEYRLSGRTENGPQDHFYLETQCSWAQVDGDGLVLVHASTQHPSETQHMVAQVLGLPSAQVVVRCVRMGGGFGGKETQANAFAALVALAAWKTGRAARIKLKREHDMILTGKRHGFRTDWEVGFDAEGRIAALRADVIADAGWSADLSPPVLLRAMVHLDNAYYLPHVAIQGRLAKTHKASNTAFRGFGGPQGVLVAEEILSAIAHFLQRPAHVVRALNFYSDPDRSVTHYLQPVGELRMARIWETLLRTSDYQARLQAIHGINAVQVHHKSGIAITPVKFGISFNKVEYNQAGALVLIYRDGSVQLNHGGTEMGQGLHTKMRIVAARSLGITVEQIRVMTTGTDKVPNTSATAASSGADLNGQAVKQACEQLLERIFAQLRRTWSLADDTPLHFEAGTCSYGAQQIGFAQSVELCYSARISLSACGYYATPGLSFDLQSNTGHPFYYFSYGAAVSEVEVDGFTGEWKLKRVDLLHDVGDSLNPLIDIGQIEGGFVQGLGWLTMEELVWNSKGKLLTTAPSTYKIPTASEVPEAFYTNVLDHATQPGVIYGSKAVGEPPLMLAISVREALRCAIIAFGDKSRGSGTEDKSRGSETWVELAAPATPEAILRAVRLQQAGAAANN